MKSSKPKFKLIFGLGNNDPQYQNTYHNVGFLTIDYLEKKQPGADAKLLKNPGYVNEAGKYLKKAAKGIKPENLLVIQDDSDITIGEYKLVFGRGAAGHHGVENIMAVLKTQNFWRLRIGIRPPQEKIRQKAEKFVLKKISPAHQKILNEVFEKAALAIKIPIF